VTANDAVAKRIAQLLIEKKMTQYRLEQQSGIQHGHMQWIMSGKSKTVTLSTVMMIANGFGMSLIEFLNDDMFLFENLNVE
jgi:transcriptional regulator with XRE-family HTH domain